MENKSQELLEEELKKAAEQVKVGGIYCNFKDPNKLYKVIGLGIQESTDTVCVIYQAEYNKKLTFVRALEKWLEKPSSEVQRFGLVR